MLIPDGVKRAAWRQRCERPALAWRVVHIDLKGPKIPPGVFADLLRLYAAWGINGVLVEYEHRLCCLPLSSQFPEEDRYSREEVAYLTELADELGIEWIPLFQSLGHCEYLSRLPGMQALVENPEEPSQLCPSRPAVRAYVQGMLDVLCELHPKSSFVHVGLDETHWLGHCPECRHRAEKLGGRLELYLEHATWVCEECVRRGRVPVVWGDMFAGGGRLDLLGHLPPETVVVPWEYSAVGDFETAIWFKGRRPCRSAFRCTYDGTRLGSALPALASDGGFADDLPSEILAEAGGLDGATGLARSFCQMRLISKHVRRLWAAGAAQASSHGLVHANFFRGALNCNQVVREVLRAGGEGAIATNWARGHSLAPVNAPWPLALYAVAQFAAGAWTGQTSRRDLEERAPEIARVLGMPDRLGRWSLDDLLWMLSNPTGAETCAMVQEILERNPGSGAFAEGLALALRIRQVVSELQFLQVEGRWWFPCAAELPARIGVGMRERLKRVESDLQGLEASARSYYLRWVGTEKDFALWWKGLFGADMELSRRAVELIATRKGE